MEPTQAVVGVIADVDAGKTTLLQALLALEAPSERPASSRVRLDGDPIENRRGMTVDLKSVRCGGLILLDTPGHADFSGELERALPAMDLALFVINGAEALSARSRVLLERLETAGVPTVLFINKKDLAGFSRSAWETFEAGKAAIVDWMRADRGEQVALSEEALLNAFVTQGALEDAQMLRAFFSTAFLAAVFRLGPTRGGRGGSVEGVADVGYSGGEAPCTRRRESAVFSGV